MVEEPRPSENVGPKNTPSKTYDGMARELCWVFCTRLEGGVGVGGGDGCWVGCSSGILRCCAVRCFVLRSAGTLVVVVVGIVVAWCSVLCIIAPTDTATVVYST